VIGSGPAADERDDGRDDEDGGKRNADGEEHDDAAYYAYYG